MPNPLLRKLYLLALPLFCSSINAEEKRENLADFKPYVSVSYLSQSENEMLDKSTQTSGSSVYIWLAGANGTEGHYFGLGYLEVAIRRYSQADLFIVGWDDQQLFDEPTVLNRWVYNRKRSLLFNQAKYENTKYNGSEWPTSLTPRFNVIRKVTDEVIRRTAQSQRDKSDASTLYDVTKFGATR